MSIGILQIVAILVVVLIVFGAGRLPGVMGDIGKGLRNFKAGLNGETPTDEKREAIETKDDDNKKV